MLIEIRQARPEDAPAKDMRGLPRHGVLLLLLEGDFIDLTLNIENLFIFE